jgi:hypothetical protein
VPSRRSIAAIPCRTSRRVGLFSLTGASLARNGVCVPVAPNGNHRWDFPCCAWSPLPACRRQSPGRSHGIYSLVRFHSLRPMGASPIGGACSVATVVISDRREGRPTRRKEALVRICAGGHQRCSSLPRPYDPCDIPNTIPTSGLNWRGDNTMSSLPSGKQTVRIFYYVELEGVFIDLELERHDPSLLGAD